jgi:hypothetical protein
MSAVPQIIENCKIYIKGNMGPQFDVWLREEGGLDFGFHIINGVEEAIKRDLPQEIVTKLWVFGIDVAGAIRTLQRINPAIPLEDIFQFMETFIRIQMNDIAYWCYELYELGRPISSKED